MIKLSLIQTCQNRREELERFVYCLNRQIGIDFAEIQLIFVDQEDNRQIFNLLDSNVDFVYLQTPHCSLSHARNLAIPFVRGEYVAFPDDDCWYEPNTLARVFNVLSEEVDGVSGMGTNEKGVLTSIFPHSATNITITRRCAAISYTLFVKFEPSLRFDENMGVGSPYNIGSGEETDYLLVLIERFNYRVKYDPNVIIHHPCTEDNTTKIDKLYKTYSYARGSGYLMKKHNFPFVYYIKQFIRPLAGTIAYMLMGDIYKSKKSYFQLKGRIEGFLIKI